MPFKFQSSERIAGVLGLLGALLMLGGDMLLYAHANHAAWVSSSFNSNLGVRVAILGAERVELLASGVLGPVAAVLYAFGFWHVYLQLRQHAPIGGAFVALAFSTMIVIGGAYHALWTHYGFILQFAATDPAGASALVENATRYMHLMYGTAAAVGYSGAIVLLVLVLAKKSAYPRWTAVINPGVLIALAPPLMPIIERFPQPTGAILAGGWINMAFTVFFLVSLATTRRKLERPNDSLKPTPLRGAVSS